MIFVLKAIVRFYEAPIRAIVVSHIYTCIYGKWWRCGIALTIIVACQRYCWIVIDEVVGEGLWLLSVYTDTCRKVDIVWCVRDFNITVHLDIPIPVVSCFFSLFALFMEQQWCKPIARAKENTIQRSCAIGIFWVIHELCSKTVSAVTISLVGSVTRESQVSMRLPIGVLMGSLYSQIVPYILLAQPWEGAVF